MVWRAVTAWLSAAAALATLCCPAPLALAMPPDLIGASPDDAWVTVMVDPSKAGGPRETVQSGGTLQAAAYVFDQARRMGLVGGSDRTTAAVMDVIGSLPLVTRYPYAVCVLDANANALPNGGYRLAELRAALIVRTGGRNAFLEGRVQHLLNTYVNAESATIEPRARGDDVTYLLTDRRLPEWLRIEWGALGDLYVMTVGNGAFDRIAATVGKKHRSLQEDNWFRSAHQRCRGGTASVEWTVRFAAIRRHLRPVMAGKPDDVLRGLGLADVDRGLWAAGASGRAVEASAMLRRGGNDEFVPICRAADRLLADQLVPPEATRYAIIEHDPGKLIRLARDVYLAARSPSAQANLRRMWTQIERETDLQVERDLLMQLGRPLVIHDYPRHPLDLPLARTIVVAITGSPVAVRTALDRLLRRYQRHLERPDSGWPMLELHLADDGVWYYQAGLYGPALAVTDHWLVISYSPVAVRQNLALLQPDRPDSGSLPARAGAGPRE